MSQIATSAHEMISGMSPELRPGTFVFATTPDPALVATLAADAVATFRESEGVSLVLSSERAEQAGFDTDQPMRCITLNVYSSLEGVGLTAAVATALAEAGIACNMIAAFHHDHAFVPSDSAERALQILQSLQHQG
ncbi:ACT domain-containing protein [Shimia sp.]|uniref:ACT domain-containing protein n=1 Tax=Shimia sp. TaxID=1954381 RepID=UPI003299C947